LDEQYNALVVARDTIIGPIKAIETQEDRERCNAARLSIKDWLGRFDSFADSVVKPMWAAYKNAKARFDEAKAPAVKFDAELERVLREDRVKQLEAQRKEQERLNNLAQKRFDRAQAAGRATPLPVPVASIVQDVGKKVETQAGTVVWVDNWKPQIVNESLIPREYLMPDMKKLAAACNAGIEVPGVLRVNEPFQRASR
jgi:hypothetical protein